MCRLIVLVLLLSLATVGYVGSESYPPSPGLGTKVEQPNTRGSDRQKSTVPSKIRTEPDTPINKSLDPQKREQAADENHSDRNEKSPKKWWMASEFLVAVFTGLLVVVTGVLAFYTYRLWSATKILVAESKRDSADQSERMRESIAEATRAATAMERLAGHMEISAKASTESVAALKERTAQQMRAYLAVSIGSGIFQERTQQLRFEVKPILVNSGHTPAHKVTYWAKAEILPVPLPDDFQFPPLEDIHSSFVLGPNQSIILNAIVDNYFPDEEVENIKRGNERRPYIWGIVSYTDVFGDRHITKFCHSIYWFGPAGSESIAGNYASRHNEAT